MFFCKLWPGKTSGFHVRYRFKVILWRPQANHLSSMLTYINIPRKYGEMYGNYEWRENVSHINAGVKETKTVI